MRVVIVTEAIPPYCGGAEQVPWIHAIEIAKKHRVSVVTFGDNHEKTILNGVEVHFLPKARHKLAAYMTTHRAILDSRP